MGGISVQIQISRPKKRHNFPNPQYQSTVTIKADVYRYGSIIQTYPIKQIIRTKNEKRKAKHSRIALKFIPKFDSWFSIIPVVATVAQYVNTLQIFPYRRLAIKIKKFESKRRLNSKYGTPKYLDTPILPPIPVSIFNPVLQGYGYKQFLARWNEKRMQKRKLISKYGGSKFQDWFIEAKINNLQTIAVNVIKILLKSVNLPK